MPQQRLKILVTQLRHRAGKYSFKAKITAHRVQLGQKLWTTWYRKTKKPTCHFWGVRGKSGGCGTDLCKRHHQRGGQTTKPSPGWPYPHPFEGTSLPHWGSEQGKLLLFFAVSTNPCPDFFLWPLINFYWLRSTRTLVRNKLISTIKVKPIFYIFRRKYKLGSTDISGISKYKYNGHFSKPKQVLTNVSNMLTDLHEKNGLLPRL